MAGESFVEGHENRVLVLSDGDANVGKTSWDQMLSQINLKDLLGEEQDLDASLQEIADDLIQVANAR